MARAFDPFLVNSVVGFIGPEYLFDERQIIRAGLEDHFMGKLLGLPMGVRRLLHQPRRRRPELGRQPADAPGRGRLQLLHGRALRRRRDAQLPVDQLPRRRGDAAALRPAPGPGVRGLAGGSENWSSGPSLLATGAARGQLLQKLESVLETTGSGCGMTRPCR